jgi:hypothetical protein
MRYLFHLFNDLTVIDDEGRELFNDAAAFEYASCEARAMAAESVCQGHLILNHRIEVTCSDGRKVGTVYFRDVVKVVG